MLTIYYKTEFSSLEKELIREYIVLNSQDFNFKQGMNYAVDVTDVIKRTANVDVEIKEI